MKIKIVQHVPTKPSPEIGKVYEVTKTNEPNERNGGINGIGNRISISTALTAPIRAINAIFFTFILDALCT